MTGAVTELVFRQDPYARTCEARVVAVNDRGGIILDRTVFYATSGGQPGDSGWLEIEGTGTIPVAVAVYDDNRDIVHVVPEGTALPQPGAAVLCRLDWDRRYAHMRIHTCLHLLCSLVPYPVTGGGISTDNGRLDFDIADPDAVNRETIGDGLNRLIAEDHPVSDRWIADEELAARPELVRTMAVKPPMGTGRVRLVEIGAGGGVDLQPCGGTHVASTAEIGPVAVQKIENKGRQNRRIRVGFA